MAGSNERGRAFEWAVRSNLLAYVVKKRLPAEETERSKARDTIESGYFNALDEETQFSFMKGAWAFAKWADKQGWFDNATKMILDRVPDNEAKKRDPTDIRLEITCSNGKHETKNISVKHHHNALCHPRLPSLAQQCGITNESIDAAYRKKYKEIWQQYYKKAKSLGKKITKHNQVPQQVKFDFLYVPLQRHVIEFLLRYANNSENAKAFFEYLTSTINYCVLKNEADHIEVKNFYGIAPPTSFKIIYPFDGKKTTFLMEFDNSWKIAFRLHNASEYLEQNGKIFASEKEDPICKNLEEMIKIEIIKKL